MVWGLPTLACAPEVLVEGHGHPCWGWIFDAQLGTADHVPVAPALFVGLLGAGYKMRQSLLGWSWVEPCGGGMLYREGWAVV